MTTPTEPAPDAGLQQRIATALREAAFWCGDEHCPMTEEACATAHPVQITAWAGDVVTDLYGPVEALAAVLAPLVAKERADEHAACYACEPCGFHWHARTPSEVVPMRDGQPVCPRCANTGHSETIPAWEAAYDSATYTPHLIGYCNDEASAKAAALAWFRAHCETTDVLAWESEPRLAVGEWDQWFILRQTDADGTALATDIVVRRRAERGETS